MTDLTGPGPAEPRTGSRQRHDEPAADEPASDRSDGTRRVDRRQQRRWVPITASWMIRLVGLADIILGVTAPPNHLHAPLQRLPLLEPGTEAALTRTADIILRLLLLMLSPRL